MDENGWIWFSKEWNLLLHGAMFSFQINLLEGRHRKTIRLPFGTIAFQPCDVLVSGVYLPSHHHIGQMKFSRIQWWKKSYCIPCFLYIYIYTQLDPNFSEPQIRGAAFLFWQKPLLRGRTKIEEFSWRTILESKLPGTEVDPWILDWTPLEKICCRKKHATSTTPFGWRHQQNVFINKEIVI